MKIQFDKEVSSEYLKSVSSYIDSDKKQYNITGGMVACYRFWNKYGFFPDRNGYSIEMDSDHYYLNTDKDLTKEEINVLTNFFNDKNNYNFPHYSERLTLDINYSLIKEKLDEYFKEDETIEVYYFAAHQKQYITFSRSLTDEEKIFVKKLWYDLINFDSK